MPIKVAFFLSHENIRLRQKSGINVKIPCCREALTVRKSVTICDNTQPISRIYSKLSTTEAENPHTVDVNRQIYFKKQPASNFNLSFVQPSVVYTIASRYRLFNECRS